MSSKYYITREIPIRGPPNARGPFRGSQATTPGVLVRGGRACQDRLQPGDSEPVELTGHLTLACGRGIRSHKRPGQQAEPGVSMLTAAVGVEFR
jgi:hypothetical protein